MLAHLLLAASLALATLASPLPEPAAADAASAAKKATNIYLLATRTRTAPAADATGLNLFDPYYQPNYLLRAQAGGASYVPFNLMQDGILAARASGPHGVGGEQPYASHLDESTGEVYFLPVATEAGTPGLFAFKGKWLALDGDTEGFTDCEGDFGQRVINWKGTDASCAKTFIYKQTESPATS